MTRRWKALLLCAAVQGALWAQQPKVQEPAPQEPPEEDQELIPKKEYSFNPIQAEKEIYTGNFYFKKHNYKAAAMRFSEATKWNPGSAEGYLRLAEAEEKLKDKKAAREAYTKYLELAPDSKQAEGIRKKLAGKS